MGQNKSFRDINEPGPVVDTWHDMGQAFKLWIRLKLDYYYFFAENNIFSARKEKP